MDQSHLIRTPVEPYTRFHAGLTALESRLLGRIDAASFTAETFNPGRLARPAVLKRAEIERAIMRLATASRIAIEARDGWRRFFSIRTGRWTGWSPIHTRRRRKQGAAA